ncbi:dedicator of cytokinesis protein [Entamoeba histolytica HM-3:IMSS]|uniref:Dedicator of cytokinesis protein n=1 Tax=Entamoeba histolytica HM-3:IMSS TaxID=885315 RepID=M7WWC9_ENTHI|nr:dedicator of cytokinesis protein [Entamoeba histolytica HM-3:IMSS]
MVTLLEKYGFKPTHEANVEISHRRGKSSIDQSTRKNEAKSEFKKLDYDDLEEIDFFQIRKFFESHSLFYSDEQIKKILKKNLITGERLNLLDFQQFYEDIKANYFNTPQEFKTTPVKWCDIFETQLKEDGVPNNCTNYTNGDLTIQHNIKPMNCTVTTQNIISEKEIIGAEQQLYLGMLLNSTTEVCLLNNKVEIPKQQVTQTTQSDVELNDEPDTKLLRKQAIIDIRTVKGNLYENYSNDSHKSNSIEKVINLTNPNDGGITFVMQIEARSLVQYEPFFGEFAIYEVINEGESIVKVTENYFVDLNTEDNKRIVRQIEKEDYEGTTCCKFLVKLKGIESKERKFYGVMYFYKMAEQDIEDAKTLYKDKTEKKEFEKERKENENKETEIKENTNSNNDDDGIKKEDKIDIEEIKKERKKKLEKRKEQIFNKSVYKFYKQHIFTGITELKSEERGYPLWMYKENIHNDNDLLKLIDKICGGKVRPIGIKTWELRVMKIQDTSAYRVFDPSGFEYKKNPTSGSINTYIKQLEDFTQFNTNQMFFTDFVNNIYIYPKELTIQHEKKKCSYIIHCYIRKEDTKFHREDTYLPLFYSESSIKPIFLRKASTSVSVNAKNDTFLDEIKAKLPIVLTPQHHLLFVIQEVLLTNEQNLPMEKMVINSYFAFLPFIQMGRIIQSGEQTIPVYNGLPYENYITTKPTETGDKTKTMTLTFNLRVVSNIYTQSSNVHRLISSIHTNYKSSKSIENAFTEIREDIDKNHKFDMDLTHTLPILVDLILGLFKNDNIDKNPISSPRSIINSPLQRRISSNSLIKENEQESGNAFKYLILLSHLFVCDEFNNPKRVPFELYTKFYLENKPNKPAIFLPLTTSLTKFFSNYLNAKKIGKLDGVFELKYLETTLEMLPVFLKMIEKSLFIYLDAAKLLYQYDKIQNDEKFCVPFNNQLKVFFKCFAQYLRQRVASRATTYIYSSNNAIAQFLLMLIRGYSRKTAMECLDIYISTLCCVEDSETETIFLSHEKVSKKSVISSKLDAQSLKNWKNVQILKVDVLKHLSHFTYFYECNAPRITSVIHISDYYTTAFSHHFLAAYIQRQYLQMLRTNDCVCRLALYSMIGDAVKLDLDPRHQQPHEKAAISEFYVFFIDYIIVHAEQIIKFWRIELDDDLSKDDSEDDTLDQTDSEDDSNTPFLTPVMTPQNSSSRLTTLPQSFTAPPLQLAARTSHSLSKGVINTKKIQKSIDLNEIRHFYLYLLWILKNMDLRTLINLINKDSPERIANLLKILQVALKYIGDLNFDVEPLFRNINEMQKDARQVVFNVICSETSNSNISILSNLHDVSESYDSSVLEDRGMSNSNVVDSALLVILEIIMHCFNKRFLSSGNEVMSELTKLIISSFTVTSAPTFFKYFMAFIRKIVIENSDYLFVQNPTFCYDLINGIIGLCGSSSPSTRKNATSVLYLFVKSNFERDENVNCVKIHITSSLASRKLLPEEESNVQSSIAKLKQWISLDFAEDIITKVKEKEINQNEDRYDIYRRKVIEKRIELLKLIENQKSINEGIWRSMRRVVIYLEERWSIDMTSDIEETLERIKNEIGIRVKNEEKAEVLRTCIDYQLNDFLDIIKTILGRLMIEKRRDEFVVIKQQCLNKLQKVLKEIKDTYFKFRLIQVDFPIKQEDVEKIVDSVIELYEIRNDTLDSEINAKTQTQKNTKEFEELQQKDRTLIWEEYCKVFEHLEEKNEVNNNKNVGENLEEIGNGLGVLEKLIKEKKEQMRKEDERKNGINVWEVLYKQWETILPKTINLFNQLIELQKSIVEYEKSHIEITRHSHEQLASAEELIKVYEWCLGVDEIKTYEMGGDINKIIERAEELIKQIPVIEKSMQYVTEKYTKDRESYRSIKLIMAPLKKGKGIFDQVINKETILQDEALLGEKLFGELYRRAANMGSWKQVLIKNYSRIQVIQKEERSKNEKRNEYSKYVKVIVKAIQKGQITKELLTVAEKAKELSQGDDDIQKLCEVNDLKLIQEYSMKDETFALSIGLKRETEKDSTIKTFKEKFIDEIGLLEQYVKMILDDLRSLREMLKEQSAELINEKYLSIAEKYKESLELHLTWYEKLIVNQEKRDNFVEAGVACVHIINSVYNVLRKNNIIKIDLNIDCLKEITVDFFNVFNSSYLNNSRFLNQRFLLKMVIQAADAFKKQNLQHYAITLFNFIIPYCASTHDFKALSACHSSVTELYQQIIELNTYVGFFYRVSFYGQAFTNIFEQQSDASVNTNNKTQNLFEYVYRSSLRSGEFVEFMKNSYKRTPRLILLTKSLSNLEQLNKDDNYIFVSSVSPCTEEKKIIDKFISTNTFASEISFTLDGAKLDELSKVCKKRTIMTTKKNLPSVLEREPIIFTEEVILTPILSCMDDIEKQIEKVALIIENPNSIANKIPQLQRLLMGILCANVNGGLFAICNTFFSEENINKYSAEDVDNLYTMVMRLVDLCKTGLAIHKSSMKLEFANLQNVMELGLVSIEKALRESGMIVDAYVRPITEEEK